MPIIYLALTIVLNVLDKQKNSTQNNFCSPSSKQVPKELAMSSSRGP